MDFRKIFNIIPEEFDKWRPRYCDELFSDLIEHSKLDASKAALEIGPGTGQATEPILKTGCSYLAVELGENFTEFMKNKFGSYTNFQIVNADFETYDFGRDKFELVYSAATFQWIKREIGYPKLQAILKKRRDICTFRRRNRKPRSGFGCSNPRSICRIFSPGNKLHELYESKK